MCFLGIDPGLTQLTTVLIARGGARRYVLRQVLKTQPTKGATRWVDRFQRTQWLGDQLADYLSIIHAVWPKKYIMLEGYSPGSSGSAVQTMAEVKQMILLAICGVAPSFKKVMLVPPNTWQACLLGDDNKRVQDENGKQRTARYIEGSWPMIAKAFGSDHNQFDAYGMAALYERLVMYPTRTNKNIERLRQREAGRL